MDVIDKLFTLTHTHTHTHTAGTLMLKFLAAIIWSIGLVAAAESDQAPIKLLVPASSDTNAFVSHVCPYSAEHHLQQEYGALDSKHSNCNFSGLAVEVFRKCAQRLSLPSYHFIPFSIGRSYDDMLLRMIADQEFDGVVADLTVSSNRLHLVDFSYPYMPSNLELITSCKRASSRDLWIFLQPFSKELWAWIVLLFFFTGILLLVFENRNPNFNSQSMKSNTKLANVFWFTGMTLFFAHRVEASTKLGRLLTIFWLMLVLIITTSYTASLASMLTTNQLIPRVQSFVEVLRSDSPIGYRAGSFSKELLQAVYGVKSSKLIPLFNITEYDRVLEEGHVVAILDESPYIDSFFNSKCGMCIKVTDTLTKLGGFGYAFKKNSTITSSISQCILELDGEGELQPLRDSWIGAKNCSQVGTTSQISLVNFHGILIVTTSFYSVCVVLKIISCLARRYKAKRHLKRIAHVMPEHERHEIVVDVMLEHDLRDGAI